MRRWSVLTLALAALLSLPAVGSAEEIRDAQSGVTLVVPDGWKRQSPPPGARLSVVHSQPGDALSFKRISLYGGSQGNMQAFKEGVLGGLPDSWRKAGQRSGQVGPVASTVHRFEFTKNGVDWQVELHFFQHRNQCLYLQLTSLGANGSANSAFAAIVGQVRLN